MPVRKPKTPPINQAEFIAEVAKELSENKLKDFANCA